MDKRFAPLGDRQGTMPVTVGTGAVGTITANTTNRFLLPVPAGKYFIYSFSVACNTVAADADGTVLATLFKYDGVAASAVAQNTAAAGAAATGDLESLVTKKGQKITLLASVADKDRIINVTDNNDGLYVDVVNNSAAIDTQPTQLVFCVELLALK